MDVLQLKLLTHAAKITRQAPETWGYAGTSISSGPPLRRPYEWIELAGSDEFRSRDDALPPTQFRVPSSVSPASGLREHQTFQYSPKSKSLGRFKPLAIPRLECNLHIRTIVT